MQIVSWKPNLAFKIKNEIERPAQSSPNFTGILILFRSILGPNLVILALTGGELWHEEAEIRVDFDIKFDIEGQGQSTPKQ